MSKRYSVSIDDEELIEFIDEMEGDVYENRSELFRKALRLFKEEKGEALKQLKTEDTEDNHFV